jgi:prepilin-type processing-associated H-X9-DG protein
MKPLGKDSRKRRAAALTLIEALVVIALLVILAGLLLPMLAKRDHRGCRIKCTSNLKQIGLSYRMWAMDHGDKIPMAVSTNDGGALELIRAGNAVPIYQVMSNELSDPKILFCWENPKLVLATNWTTGFSAKNISYFIGLDAATNNPTMVLAGDDHLQIRGVPVKPGLLEFTTNSPISWTAARHNSAGNIALADGSVQQVPPRAKIPWGGVATNRILLP